MEYKPYNQILLEYNNNHVPYNVKLSAVEWDKVRERILERENNHCQICHGKCMEGRVMKLFGNFLKMVPATYQEIESDIEHLDVLGNVDYIYKNTSIKLVEMENPLIAHVHHTYYILNKLPWDYPEDALMLVCHMCHRNIHLNENIKVYLDEQKREFLSLIPCDRCGGTGYLPQYNYWQNGVCFQCNGERFDKQL